MIIEVMGRHAGWIAIESVLAGGADIILIPEIPFEIEHVVRSILKRDAGGRHFSIVVVAEGAAPHGGTAITVGDPNAPARLGGIGNWLAGELGKLVEHEVRSLVLGHLQRGGSPTPQDRNLGTRFGVEAVHLVARKEYGRMVALHGTQIVSVALEEAVGILKRVDPNSALVGNARCLGIGLGAD
jgi:6-phosphofructokinase 1